MANTFPCPNPTCNAVFSPDAIKGASALKCSRCGTVFQFRPATAAAPARPSAPAGKAAGIPSRPVPAAPSSSLPSRPAPPALPRKPSLPPPAMAPAPVVELVPVAPAPPVAPVAMPVEDALPAALDFSAGSPARPSAGRRRKSRRGPNALIKPLVLCLFFAAIGVGGYLALPYLKDMMSDEPAGDDSESAGTFKFKPPAKPWKQDKDAQLGLKVNPAFRRADPPNVLALHFKDFKDRLPSEPEMLDEALAKLRGYFAPFEWELKPKSEDDKLGGLPALVMNFEGTDPNQVPMSGECWMLGHHGMGYWIIAFAPSEGRDEAAAEWARIRQGFSLTNKREGWKPKPRETETFKGDSVAFRLSAYKDVWKKQAAGDLDAKAEVLLEGTFDPRAKEQHASKKAFFQVVVLPKAPSLKEATAAALKYVADREKTSNDKCTLEPIKDKMGVAEKELKVAGMTLQRLRLEVRVDGEAFKYMDLTVANLGDGSLALVGECPWSRREYWEQQFTPLITSLRMK